MRRPALDSGENGGKPPYFSPQWRSPSASCNYSKAAIQAQPSGAVPGYSPFAARVARSRNRRGVLGRLAGGADSPYFAGMAPGGVYRLASREGTDHDHPATFG